MAVFSKKKKVLLISSDGGHLAQMLELLNMFKQYDYLLVTEGTSATFPLKEKYKMAYLKARPKGVKRSVSFLITLFGNLFLSVKLLVAHYPKVIITTGSHTAVPMCLIGKMLGIKVVWILSFARVSTKSKSADFVYPFADIFIVQWEEVQKLYPKSIYLGGVY